MATTIAEANNPKDSDNYFYSPYTTYYHVFSRYAKEVLLLLQFIYCIYSCFT